MSDQAGRGHAGRMYPVLGYCERCLVVPAYDRHHVDGNTHNNRRENLRFLCRRCHQIEDGRDAVLAAGRAKVAARQRAKTECPNGHPWSPENTYRRADGSRSCRECHRLLEQARRDRNRA